MGILASLVSAGDMVPSTAEKIPVAGPYLAPVLRTGGSKFWRLGAMAGFGFAKGYYREKFLFMGKVPYDIGLGVAALLGETYCKAKGVDSDLCNVIGGVADAGIMSFLDSYMVSLGAKAAGRQVVVIDSKAALPPDASQMVLGEIPAAGEGAYLTAEEIAKYSQPR